MLQPSEADDWAASTGTAGSAAAATQAATEAAIRHDRIHSKIRGASARHFGRAAIVIVSSRFAVP
jgi:hypothetical protein